ncbi:hypothetical protein MKZ38_009780 [Zalerion maritima]|uniref:Uncharacterized protein n=1 Tax=Zalerion maritima TaxID=339359 RepID=A0AAD5RY97_9PEZI|nr:hypothetical protein MKZ38_009780 [Zalerion maritima]
MTKLFPDLPDGQLEIQCRSYTLNRHLNTTFTKAIDKDIVRLCQELESGCKWDQWEVVLEEFKSRNEGCEWFDVEDLQFRYLSLMNEAKVEAGADEARLS